MINRALSNKVRKYNPKWSRQVIDFLRCKIDHLSTSSMDYDDEISKRSIELVKGLDMNKDSCCIVGELYNFTLDSLQCYICNNYAMSLYNNNSQNRKELFREELENFYYHVECEHSELIK